MIIGDFTRRMGWGTWVAVGLVVSVLGGPARLSAAESLCATVKIELSQELTLERQAFDAHMRINNGIALPLTEVHIEVNFTDENDNPVLASSDPDADALFFIEVDSMSYIESIDAGTVAASTSADIHWLIIPNPGAGGSNSVGTLYYVGATLTYKLGGEEHVVEVAPDTIYVKSMPDLLLDYFLPGEVYGDDAFTPSITEPPVPFSLGVRVRNEGHGLAKSLKLDTGQPQITANAQGLLVGFQIGSCEVRGEPQPRSLLVDFGDIPAEGGAALARWIMTCTLSGTFTNFTASFSHADELGGQLTSLIQSGNVLTHLLIHDVLVDVSGTDSIRDFLATDSIVYGSDGVDRSVTNVSSLAQLAPQGGGYALRLSQPTTGFIYVKLDHPESSGMVVKEVVRSDGKKMPAENVWLSKTRKTPVEAGWNTYFNLFDHDASSGSYTVTYEPEGAENRAPVLAYIGSKKRPFGEPVSFAVSASDPDGTTPAISAGTLPVGARFTENGNGEGAFVWTPFTNQMGEYRIKFTASDGVLTDSETIVLKVLKASAGTAVSLW